MTSSDTVNDDSIGIVVNGVTLVPGTNTTDATNTWFATKPAANATYVAATKTATLPNTGSGFLLATAAPAGTYSAFIFYDANGSGTYTSADVKSTNFTVTVSGSPTSMSVAPTSTAGLANSAVPVDISLKDAAGRQTTLTLGEQITLAASSLDDSFSTTTTSSVTGGLGTSKIVKSDDYQAGLVTSNGRLVGLINSVAANKNITFTPNAVLTTGGVSSPVTIQVQWVGASSGAIAASQTSVVVPTDAVNTLGDPGSSVVPAGTTTITVNAYTTAGTAMPYLATSNAAKGTAWFSQSGTAISDANGKLTITMTVPAGVSVDGNSITLALYGSATKNYEIAFSAGTPGYTIFSPSSTIITQSLGGTTNITVVVTNEFELPISGAVVTYQLAAGSRNGSATVATTLGTVTTGADGTATYALKDTSTSTTNLTDTVNISSVTLAGVAVPLVSGGFNSLIINYSSATLTSLTMVPTGDLDETTSTDVASLTTGANGTRGSFTVFSAPVGVPVTVTAPAGAKISTVAGFNMTGSDAKDTLTLYPGSGGTLVYIGSTKSGANKVTASGPGKTADLTYTFISPTSSARVLSVTPDKTETAPGTTVSMEVSVKDGWGNPVPGVVVQATANGIVYFGGGLATQSLTTNAAGTARFIAVSPANLSGTSLVSFAPTSPAATSAQWGNAAGVPITGFPAGVATASTTIETKGGAGSKTIVIVGERGTVSGKSGIIVDGTTKGFDVGSKMVPNLRFPGETTFTAGSARPTTNAAGDFSWQRKTGKRVTVFFSNEAGDIRSNRVTIQTS